MAYKFQVGEATLSGSTKFEEQLDAAGGIKLSGISDTAVAVASDSILFYDSDGSMKRDTIADFATALASTGAGLAANSGQIGVNSGNGLKIDSDTLVVEPADFAGTGLEDDGSDNLRIAAAAAGDGLTGGGGSALAVQTSGAVHIAGDKVSITGSFAGDGLAYAGGVDSIEGLTIDIANIPTDMTGDVADGDHFAIDDGGNLKKVDFSVVRDAVFADVSGDATVAAGGALTIAADSVEGTMLNTNAADGTTMELSSDSLSVLKVPNALSQGEGIAAFSFDGSGTATVALSASVGGEGLAYGSGVLKLDMNELTAAAVSVANDSIAIIDADDSNASKKESIADLMSAVAGTGLAASSGVLNARLDVGLAADGDTLAAGMNYMADMSSDGEDVLTLPASPSVGDVVHVKAPSDCSQARTVRIDRAGSQTIDGLNSVTIESPFGAVSMVYVASNLWRLI